MKQLLITPCIVRKQMMKQPLWLRLQSIQVSILGTQEGQHLFQSQSMIGLEILRNDGDIPKALDLGEHAYLGPQFVSNLMAPISEEPNFCLKPCFETVCILQAERSVCLVHGCFVSF